MVLLEHLRETFCCWLLHGPDSQRQFWCSLGPVRFHEVLVVVKSLYDETFTLIPYDAPVRRGGIDVAYAAVPKLVFIDKIQPRDILAIKRSFLTSFSRAELILVLLFTSPQNPLFEVYRAGDCALLLNNEVLVSQRNYIIPIQREVEEAGFACPM
jgi:hypothetical protein